MAHAGLGVGRFRPGLLPTALTLLLLVILGKLGFWQLDRAQQKESLREQVVTKQNLEPLLSVPVESENSSALHWRRASLKGVFKADIIFLLDNQVYQGRAGYFVYSVLEIDGNKNLLVNRGWIKANPDRKIVSIPNLEGSTEALSGIIKAPPATGWLLAEGTDEILDKGIVRLQHIDPVALNDHYQLNIAPYIFRLDEDSPLGFTRDWTEPGFGKDKHLGYAFQWFAMAIALLIIYIVVNTDRTKNDK